MKKIKSIVASGIAVIALALVGVFAASASQAVFAQSVNPTATPSVSAPATGGSTTTAPNGALAGKMGRGFGGEFAGGGEMMEGGMFGAGNQQSLADALGVTLVQLQDAIKSANAEAIKQAVAQGLITQAQADQLTANGRAPRFAQIDENALLAKALNISVDQLNAGRLKAEKTTLDAAVKAGNLTQAQEDLMLARSALAYNSAFQTNLKTAYTSAINQAVKDGVITQAQADAILAQQSNGKFGGMGGGMMGGHGGRGGHGMFLPGTNNGTDNSTTPQNNGTVQ